MAARPSSSPIACKRRRRPTASSCSTEAGSPKSVRTISCWPWRAATPRCGRPSSWSATGQVLSEHLHRLAMESASHLVHIEDNRHPATVGVEGTLDLRRLVVHPPANVIVIDRPPPPVELVHHPVRTVAIHEGDPGILGDAAKKPGGRISHPDGQLFGPVDLSGAVERELGLTLIVR